MLSADIRIFPGKELKALDMAEILDASVITSGIIQGCKFTHQYNTLSMSAGRILIRGRLGYFAGGTLATTGIAVSGDYKVLAVCDLQAATNIFYIDYFDTAAGGAYESIVARVNQQTSFNANDGVSFVEIGTATIDASTGNVTKWTPKNAVVKRDSDAYIDLSNEITDGLASIDAAWKNSVTRWVNYIQQRLHSADYIVTTEELITPNWTVNSGATAAISCPAIRGSVIRATSATNRSETVPADPGYDPQRVDGVPTVIDNAPERYVAKAITGIMIRNAQYQSGGKAIGKNFEKCYIYGFNVAGSGQARRGYVYVRNCGNEAAIIDVTFRFMFVRRG